MTIAGTLRPDDASHQLWDVIVVGAGPAGSVTARELVRLGRRVLLVDKASFPRSKVCGCCLSGSTLVALKQIGLAELPAKLGAVPLRNMMLAANGRSAVVALPTGVALSRAAFDAELVREAIAEGVEFLPETQAVLASHDDSGRQVELRRRDGTSICATRLVIAADGLASRLLEVEEPAVVRSGSRIGAGAVVESAPAFFECGTVYMACAAAGYVGLVRLEDGRLDIAAALDPEAVREQKGPGPLAAAILTKANWPSIAEFDSAVWRGTPPLTRQRPRLGADRLFITGDASGYVEPITGEGIAWALHSAIALAPLADRAIESWEARWLDKWAKAHRRLLGARQRSCGLLSRALRSPFLTQMLIRTLALAPALARPFVHRLNSGQKTVVGGQWSARKQRAVRSEQSEKRHRRLPTGIQLTTDHCIGDSMGLAIVGLGKSLPPATITQEEGARIAQILCCRSEEQMTWLPMMYGQTSIEHRFIALGSPLLRDLLDGTRDSGSIFLPKDVADDAGPTTGQRMKLYAELAVPLAVDAAEQALTEARMKANEITHLVTVSCTGFIAPGVEFSLIERLGLKPTVQRTNVGFMGCHGAINGMRVAAAFAGADPKARVLLCAVELSSLHYHYGWDPQKIIANALFGDGSAAIVGVPSRSGGSSWVLAATGSCVLPRSADAMTWSIGEHGFEMTLSKKVPGLIAEHLRPWLEQFLKEQSLRVEDIRSWAIHPGGPRILDAAEEVLGLKPEQTWASREVLAACGNMSSPTVLFIMDRLRRANAPLPAVALAFGPGLVAEGALFIA